MSKLPHAPLLEVIYELRWTLSDMKDLGDFQYLHGDLYNALKESYPFRQNLVPIEFPPQMLVNNPIFRFRRVENGYPLFQLGPGVLSLNTTDLKYHWEEYFNWCKELTNSFIKIYPKTKELTFKPNLIYIDFYKFDFINDDIIKFLNKQLNINFGQTFYKSDLYPNSISGSFGYNTETGNLEISFNKGKDQSGNEGLVLKTQLNGDEVNLHTNAIYVWLDKAHEFCSNLFKDMTKGELYNSFLN